MFLFIKEFGSGDTKDDWFPLLVNSSTTKYKYLGPVMLGILGALLRAISVVTIGLRKPSNQPNEDLNPKRVLFPLPSIVKSISDSTCASASVKFILYVYESTVTPAMRLYAAILLHNSSIVYSPSGIIICSVSVSFASFFIIKLLLPRALEIL